MSRYISEDLRGRTELRANGICEYCRIRIEDTYFGDEIDHIINLKHRENHFGKSRGLPVCPAIEIKEAINVINLDFHFMFHFLHCIDCNKFIFVVSYFKDKI